MRSTQKRGRGHIVDDLNLSLCLCDSVVNSSMEGVGILDGYLSTPPLHCRKPFLVIFIKFFSIYVLVPFHSFPLFFFIVYYSYKIATKYREYPCAFAKGH